MNAWAEAPWHETFSVLVPAGHEDEARRLAEGLCTKTISANRRKNHPRNRNKKRRGFLQAAYYFVGDAASFTGVKMWQTDDNKAVVHRYVEAYNAKNLAALDHIFASTYIDHAQPAGQPPQPPGPAFKKLIFAQFFQSFPDAHLTIEDLVAEGDKINVRLTMSGTHREAFMGIPAKGRRFRVSATNVFRIRDGMITDSWGVIDMATLIQQIQQPRLIDFSWGRKPPTPEENPTASSASPRALAPEYWARWDFTAEEWKQFDQLDWGRTRNTLLVTAAVVVMVCVSCAIFFFVNLYSSPLPSAPPPDYIGLVGLIVFMALPSFLITYAVAGRQFREARKRHLARKADSRRVTIGNPSSWPLPDQGLWIAGTFVPLQATFLKLNAVKLTEKPLSLHLRRKHIEIRQSSWHDTLRLLVPPGHEAEAAQLVERFRTETMAPLNKDMSPPEP